MFNVSVGLVPPQITCTQPFCVLQCLKIPPPTRFSIFNSNCIYRTRCASMLFPSGSPRFITRFKAKIPVRKFRSLMSSPLSFYFRIRYTKLKHKFVTISPPFSFSPAFSCFFQTSIKPNLINRSFFFFCNEILIIHFSISTKIYFSHFQVS